MNKEIELAIRKVLEDKGYFVRMVRILGGEIKPLDNIKDLIIRYDTEKPKDI